MSTTLSPAPVTGRPKTSAPSRIDSIDILRGLVMVIMALDHTRDYFTHLRFEPETLSKTYYALFFARWITHFCAPLFFFLAGTGAYFYGRRRTPQQLSRFLWTRGLWLIVVEFTIVGFAWSFVIPFGFFGVIWALGASMVLMAGMVRLPVRWLAALSLFVIAAHDLLDPVRPAAFGSWAPLWKILHVRGFVMLGSIPNFVLFPLIPWVAVMGAGYAFGTLYNLEPERRRKLIFNIGLACTLAFIFLRATNLYGNPPAGLGGVSQGDWHIQPTLEKTVILFLDVEKYPPSLQFLLMTLGPSLLLLGWMEGRFARGKPVPLASPMVIFGRVPMFYYVLHLYLIHTLAVLAALLFRQPVHWLLHGAFMQNGIPNGYGHNLPFIYFVWITAVVILYFPCRYWAGLKQRRKDWWLSYL
ncbi:MAG TPA: heparan-alpha-glucosaminide N-acetyltransferase domain-containing protein [Candidatus Binatia bacterium]|nr:heparan-alpha-glucosaminide N-acetyltransferase domain-containing protein [Candidatus Binatia bacterium]